MAQVVYVGHKQLPVRLRSVLCQNKLQSPVAQKMAQVVYVGLERGVADYLRSRVQVDLTSGRFSACSSLYYGFRFVIN
jgi:hypothetical protein